MAEVVELKAFVTASPNEADFSSAATKREWEAYPTIKGYVTSKADESSYIKGETMRVVGTNLQPVTQIYTFETLTGSIDIDNTCIGFITALDLASCYFVANKYKRIIIVTSEIASVGLDYTHIQSASLFGDGATATIVENDQNSYVLGSVFKTYSKGTSFTEIRGGGAKMHPKYYGEGTLKDFSFQMNGEDVYKLTRKYAPKIQNQILEESKCTLENINCIIFLKTDAVH